MLNTFRRVENEVLVSRELFEGDMPADWPNKALYELETEGVNAPQIGWKRVNGVWERPLPSALSPEEQRKLDILQRVEVADIAQRLNSATPEQIDAWFDANITSLATAKIALATIAKLLAAKL